MHNYRPTRGVGSVAGIAVLALSVAGCSSPSAQQPRTGGAHAGQPARAAAASRHVPPATTPAASTAAPAIPDACTLLSRAEAQAVAAVPLQAGQDTRAASADNTASCTYNAPVTGSSGSITVFVQVQTPDALTTDRNLGHKFDTVPGIGDQTLLEANNVFVHKGQLWMVISSAYQASPKVLVDAARLGAARLP
ncbi:MAG: hypothetical protein M3042_11745 [Actinomycetota bacterium]|nr:hypothetical protein [Actinomycetota bacterium]